MFVIFCCFFWYTKTLLYWIQPKEKVALQILSNLQTSQSRNKRTWLSVLNHLTEIVVITVLQLLLIHWFIKHVKIFEFVIWHMQQKLIKYYMLLLRFELYMLSDSF